MKVRYTLPVSGTLRKLTPTPIMLGAYNFGFAVDEQTGFINKLVVEIANIPEEHWPTLTPVEQDPTSKIPRFPFEINKNVLTFSETAPHLRNLESYLSVFGLDRIDFSALKEEWFADRAEESASMLQSFTYQKSEIAPVAEPLSDNMIARCIAASATKDNKDTLFLAYFRVAQGHFFNELFVESIKFSYLCLETLFGDNQTKNNKVMSAFSRSTELVQIVKRILFEERLGSFDVLCKKHRKLQTPEDIIKFFVLLRGRLQHANLHPNFRWHPSMQADFRVEAECIFTIAEEVCLSKTLAKLRAISVSSTPETS